MSGGRHLQDCYFFYYSKCNKGDACDFRHEPAALGSETMCTQWQKNLCTNAQCPLRHMQLKKNRKSIPCYWESQLGGCRKPHCAFFHKEPRPDNVLNSQGVNGVNQQEQGANPNRPAEALLVNFQESMHLY